MKSGKAPSLASTPDIDRAIETTNNVHFTDAAAPSSCATPLSPSSR
jgi:hypothetical protein